MALAGDGCARVPVASVLFKEGCSSASQPLPYLAPGKTWGRGMEGRDRVATATVLRPGGQHSLTAAPGMWVLLGVPWVKMAFPRMEKGRTKKKDAFGKRLVLGCTWPWGWAEGGPRAAQAARLAESPSVWGKEP